MKIENWSEELRTAVLRRRAMLDESSGSTFWAAAQTTGGLPVYCDLGGCLVIDPDGRLMLFDSDSLTVRDPASDKWLQLACIVASEKYPELKILRPQRATGAKSCPDCGGSGRNQLGVRCEQCLGLGWID